MISSMQHKAKQTATNENCVQTDETPFAQVSLSKMTTTCLQRDLNEKKRENDDTLWVSREK